MRRKMIFLGLSVVLFAASFAAVPAQDRRVLAEAERVTGDRFRVGVKTPKGANVYAVNRPSTAVLKAIDAGLTELFTVARRAGYRKRLNYSDYSIFMRKPTGQRTARASILRTSRSERHNMRARYLTRAATSTPPEW